MILHHQRLDKQNRHTLVLGVDGGTKSLKFGVELPQIKESWVPHNLISLDNKYHFLTFAGRDDHHSRAHWVLNSDLTLRWYDLKTFVDNLVETSDFESIYVPISQIVSLQGLEFAIDDVYDIIKVIYIYVGDRKEACIFTHSEGYNDMGAQHLAELNDSFPHFYSSKPQAIMPHNLSEGRIRTKSFGENNIEFDMFLPLDDLRFFAFNSDPENDYIGLMAGYTRSIVVLADASDNRLYCSQHTLQTMNFRSFQYVKAKLIIRWLGCVLCARTAERFSKVGLVFREAHLGHYIWSELSSVEDVRSQQREPYLFLTKQCSEPVFPIAEIYPEYIGRITYGTDTPDYLKASALMDIDFFPFMSYRVSKDLSQRVMRVARALDPEYVRVMSKRKKDNFLLLIGLRLENRVWIRQAQGYMELIKKLARESDWRFTVIFDGHNYLDPAAHTFVTSYHEQSSEIEDGLPKIVGLEKALVGEIKRFVSDRQLDNITIFDEIPCSMARSLISSAFCDYFITHWGAGLAKYKWIANAEGLILSSKMVLSGKSDLRIYDTPEFLEEAVEADYYPYEQVYDLDDSMSEIQTNQPTRTNFDTSPEFFANFAHGQIRKRMAAKDRLRD